ncbi:MAG: hypothetical protein NXH83_17205 [Rhodobacteraceae bacterium]|nr:hypothetical protein [Paracoccaceae bacterium]
MEFLAALIVFLIAAGGLAAGLWLTGRPPQTACDGADCLGGGRCAACPRRKGAPDA